MNIHQKTTVCIQFKTLYHQSFSRSIHVFVNKLNQNNRQCASETDA